MKRRSALKSQVVKRKKKRDLLLPFRLIRLLVPVLLKVTFLAVILIGFSLCFMFLYNYLLTSPHMRLEEVRVEGVDETLRAELIQLGRLNPGLSVLALNLNDLKVKMEEHPWIRSVKLERRFPHTLIVQAEKQVPSAIVVKDTLWYMNQWGDVFKEVQPLDSADFPIITTGAENELETPEELKPAAGVIRHLSSEKGMWSLEKLSEIHVRTDGRMSFYFNHLAAEIRFKCENLTGQMDGLTKVVEHLNQTGRIHQVTGIDLDYMDGAVVSFKKG